MMKYIIIDADDIMKVDFSEVLETSPETVRYSLDKSKVVLKYSGDQPDFVYIITQDSIGLQEYTHDEIVKILDTEQWTDPY